MWNESFHHTVCLILSEGSKKEDTAPTKEDDKKSDKDVKDIPQLDGQWDDDGGDTSSQTESNVMLDHVVNSMSDLDNREDPELCRIFGDDVVVEAAPLSEYRLWQCDGAGDESPGKGKDIGMPNSIGSLMFMACLKCQCCGCVASVCTL